MDFKESVSTIQRSVKVIIYVFIFIIAFIPTYALVKPIRALAAGNTMLLATMFIAMWMIFFFVGYMGTYALMTRDQNFNEIQWDWWKRNK